MSELVTRRRRGHARRDGIQRCRCGANRWRTLVKGVAWTCTRCRRVRSLASDIDLEKILELRKHGARVEAPA